MLFKVGEMFVNVAKSKEELRKVKKSERTLRKNE